MWQARLKIRTTLLEDSRPGHLYKAYSTAKQYCNSKPKNSEEIPSFQRRISSKVSKEKIPAKNWRKQSVAADTNKHNASPTLLHSDKEKNISTFKYCNKMTNLLEKTITDAITHSVPGFAATHSCETGIPSESSITRASKASHVLLLPN